MVWAEGDICEDCASYYEDQATQAPGWNQEMGQDSGNNGDWGDWGGMQENAQENAGTGGNGDMPMTQNIPMENNENLERLMTETANLQERVNYLTLQVQNLNANQAGIVRYCCYFARKPNRGCKYGHACRYVHELSSRITVLNQGGQTFQCERQVNRGFCKHAGRERP